MKTISLPLIAVLALVFAPWTAPPAQAASPYYTPQPPNSRPYIGPFYPYPQVPLGWRPVQHDWDDGWWFLDFVD
jgi:hypothetical protein